MNAEIRNCEVRSTLSFSQLPKPLSSPPCTQVPQSTAPPHCEGKFIQTSQSVHAPHAYSVIQMQSVLGAKWNIEVDVFPFSVALKERPATRRGILATVASVYDPLGFLSPHFDRKTRTPGNVQTRSGMG